MMRSPGSPIELLSDLLQDGDLRVARGAFGGHDAAAIATLVRAGLIVPAGIFEATVCEACHDHHLVEVDSDRADGSYGWHCPEAGFVVCDPDALAALFISIDRVVTALSKAFTVAFGTPRWKPRPLDGTYAWIVGVWTIGGVWTTVALARGLELAATARRTGDAIAALAQNDAGLVLTIGEDAGFEPPTRFITVPLTAAVMLEADGQFSVDTHVLVRAVVSRATAPLTLHVGRPSVELKVFTVLDGLSALGELPGGRTPLGGVVMRAWSRFHSNEQSPKPSTLRKHIGRWRSLREFR